MNNFDFVRPATRALWKLEDNGEDAGPYGYDVTYGNLDYALGKFGRCGYFDGNNYLASMDNYPGLALTTLSICFWMRSNSTTERYALGNVDLYDYTYGFNCGITDSKVFFETFNGSGHNYRTTGGSISLSDDKWHWIAITRGATYTRFYIDGKLDYTDTNTALAYDGDEVTCIGAWWCDYDKSAHDHFFGYIDNMQILSIELNHATIRRLYAFQIGR